MPSEKESAFPAIIEYANTTYRSKGMTLRQYYAAKAMNALIERFDHRSNLTPYKLSVMAFEAADAMIEFEDDEQIKQQS